MHIFNNVEPEHLGSGVVLFRRAITTDWVAANKIASDIVLSELSEMYTPSIDPNTGEESYVNRSGYYFSKSAIDQMPRRGTKIHDKTDEEIKSLFSFIEECKDLYLLKYMHMFPIVYKNIWWKVKGHLTNYLAESNGYIGEHSDTSVNYKYGAPHPTHQLASRNTLSCAVYFSDCVDDSELTEYYEFSGGHHYFTYLDIDYAPQKGDIMMFPSNYVAAHEVRPVTGGNRFSYLGWYAHGTPNREVNEEVVDPLLDPQRASVSSNVYMPTLREDFLKHLRANGEHENSSVMRLVLDGRDG
jgi:hypothetical protein